MLIDKVKKACREQIMKGGGDKGNLIDILTACTTSIAYSFYLLQALLDLIKLIQYDSFNTHKECLALACHMPTMETISQLTCTVKINSLYSNHFLTKWRYRYSKSPSKSATAKSYLMTIYSNYLLQFIHCYFLWKLTLYKVLSNFNE